MGEYVFLRTPKNIDPVAQVRGWSYLTDAINGLNLTPDEAIEVQKANARLIAAAPEMYKLLKEVLQAPDFAYGAGFSFCQRVDELLEHIDGKDAEHE